MTEDKFGQNGFCNLNDAHAVFQDQLCDFHFNYYTTGNFQDLALMNGYYNSAEFIQLTCQFEERAETSGDGYQSGLFQANYRGKVLHEAKVTNPKELAEQVKIALEEHRDRLSEF